MKPQKQLFRHDPANGSYGDCHRTAIACVLDLDAADVPHFMDGKHQCPADDSHKAVEAWLNARGLTHINVLYSGELSLQQVLDTVRFSNPNSGPHVFILGGHSRNGLNHSVVCCDGQIVCDPALDDSGIVGPIDGNGHWHVTFFATAVATMAPPAVKAKRGWRGLVSDEIGPRADAESP